MDDVHAAGLEAALFPVLDLERKMLVGQVELRPSRDEYF